ncbi:hypothetical protein HanRHA438_Chr16g0776091 [Helianthus annuus]|nr:hypothetical protein HanRHA438_Chr16g0776091 [Helianthus annuus]
MVTMYMVNQVLNEESFLDLTLCDMANSCVKRKSFFWTHPIVLRLLRCNLSMYEKLYLKLRGNEDKDLKLSCHFLKNALKFEE